MFSEHLNAVRCEYEREDTQGHTPAHMHTYTWKLITDYEATKQDTVSI